MSQHHYYKLALLVFVSSFPQPCNAINATWNSLVTQGDWGNGANWAGTAPINSGDTATFTTPADAQVTNSTTVSTLDLQAISAGEVVTIEVRDMFTIDTALTNSSSGNFIFQSNTNNAFINFGTAAPQHDITLPSHTQLETNLGTISFNNASQANEVQVTANGGQIGFYSNSSATNGSIFNLSGPNGSSVGRVDMYDHSELNNCILTVDGFGFMNFENSSSTDASTFTNQNGGETRFATSGTISNIIVTNSDNGSLVGTSGAVITSGTITNNAGGEIVFTNAASLGGANITNSGLLLIEDDLSAANNVGGLAGNAQITNESDGEIDFSDHGDADHATITNNSGGLIEFQNSSTANQAQINNQLGALVFFHDNSTAANSTINNAAGGLIIFSDTSSSDSATIQNDGTLNFSQTNNATCLNDISGSGIVSVNMFNNLSNILTFQNSNKSYSGPTNIQNGVLKAGSTNTFSSNSIILMSNNTATGLDLNGFSQTIAGLEGGSNDAQVNLTGLLTLQTSNTADLLFSGIITGGGDLEKDGLGKQSLQNNYTYTGTTTINGGELNVNGTLASPVLVNGGIFSGNALVPSILSTGGTISPGNSIGTIQTTGNFNLSSSSNLMIEINTDLEHDLVIAGGQANIDGTLTVVPDAGTYLFSMPYPFITAGTGVHGTFANIASFPSLTFNVIYGSNTLQLLVANTASLSPSSVPTSGSGHHLLRNLLKISPTLLANTPLWQALKTMNGFTSLNQVGKALKHIEPSPLISLGDISHEITNSSSYLMSLQAAYFRTLSKLAQVLSWVKDNSSEMVETFLSTIKTTTNSIPQQLAKFLSRPKSWLQSEQGMVHLTPSQEQLPQDLRSPLGKANIWFQQTGKYFKIQSDHNNVGLQARTHASSLGIDYKVCDNLLLGMMVTAGWSNFNWYQSRGKGKVSNYLLGIYGSWTSMDKKWYVDFNSSFAREHFKANRHIKFPGFSKHAKSSHGGFVYSTAAETGYELALPNRLSLQPHIHFGYFLLHEPHYKEHGAGNIGAHVSRRTSQFLRTGTGLEIAKLWVNQEWIIRPSLRLGYTLKHGFDAANRLKASYGEGLGHFTVCKSHKTQHLVNGAINLSAVVKNGLSLGLTYNTELNKRYQIHEGLVRLGWAF